MATLGSAPVLIVCLSRGFGGTEIRVMTTAAALHRKRVYAVATLKNSPLHRRMAAQGLRAVPVAAARVDPRILLRLCRLIAADGYTILDAHNPQSYFWGFFAARLQRVQRSICTVHQVFAKKTRGWWKPWLYTTVIRLSAKSGCRFVAVSCEIVAWLQSLGVASERILFSANGLALDWASQRQPSDVRAERGWNGKYVIGVIGRLVREKGHLVLLDSLARLCKGRPDLRCLVVGDGPELPSLSAATARLGLSNIAHFVGYREDIASLLAECDVICLPSLTEGMPYLAIEAASLARPLVLTAVGDIPAYFAHGKTAWIVPPGDVAALTQALGEALDDPRRAAAMGIAAQAMVRERLSAGRMTEETLRFYDAR